MLLRSLGDCDIMAAGIAKKSYYRCVQELFSLDSHYPPASCTASYIEDTVLM